MPCVVAVLYPLTMSSLSAAAAAVVVIVVCSRIDLLECVFCRERVNKAMTSARLELGGDYFSNMHVQV